MKTTGMYFLLAAMLALAVLVASCKKDDQPTNPVEDLRTRFNLKALPAIPYPPDNPPMQERIAVGRLVYFDPLLSGKKDVACATCHHPAWGMADGRQFSAGVNSVGLGPERYRKDATYNLAPRNSPTVFNLAYAVGEQGDAAYNGFMFWDGRVKSLEVQATKPITSNEEMRADMYDAGAALDTVVARLRAIPQYEQLFQQAFPEEADSVKRRLLPSAITRMTYQKAIAAYERELVTPNSPYDRYVAGDDNALTASQKRGLELFFDKGKCAECHPAPVFSNFQFHALGVKQVGTGRPATAPYDFGRSEHTSKASDKYCFRTPPLRQVELTGPYMHDGVLLTLRDVVKFFNRGGGDEPSIPRSALDSKLQALNLTDQEIDDLVEFLKALTDRTILSSPLMMVPDKLPSGLTPPR
jgi:cytochrome c peroxidase